MRKLLCLSAIMGLALLAGSTARAADNDAKQALKERREAFISAFEKGDAKALADFWTEDGDYVAQTGRTFKGRKAIEAALEKQLAVSKGAKLHITTTELRVVNGDLAIEDGVTEIVYPNDVPPTATRYTAIHVKKDGKWQLASVRDAILVPRSNDEHLSELAWLEGDWTDEAEKGEQAKASYTWAENNNFLVSSFATTIKDVPVAGGTQWIGWDAAKKTIRSWSFNSNGGFAEGTWSHDGDKWTIKVNATTHDGEKITANVTITKVDNDHLTWKSTDRMVGDKAVPESNLIKMKRVK